MTSTTTGLPDRYRPLDQVGPDEPTPTGVIRCWRAKDRVLNRDVAIRVHDPAGPAAHAWITRALAAGGLATPALAMVYDASEGTGDPQSPGGAAYVVNEWIEGETLAERLTRGPLPERDVRTVLRRLADGVAEAHRVGLAVGGLTPANVVLRPNGLVGLRAVPAATGTVDGDIAALGALLEATLTGLPAGPAETAPRPLTGPPDLVALVRRTRSTDPGQGLSSAAAMAALLAERPHTGPAARVAAPRGDEADSGWLRRRRDKPRHAGSDGSADAEPVRLDHQTLPPVPAVRPVGSRDTSAAPVALGGDTIGAGTVAPESGAYAGAAVPPAPAAGRHAKRSEQPAAYDDHADDGYDDEPFSVLSPTGPDETFSGEGYLDDVPRGAEAPEEAKRHRAVVVGLPLLALAIVIALAWWVGSSLLSVAGSVDGNQGSTPPVSASVGGSGSASPPKVAAGSPVKIVAATVFDPQGDGQSENDRQAPFSYDGNPSTAWKTLEYRGSAAFGNLKKGVGIVYDLGSPKSLSAVTLSSLQPGAALEIRTGADPHGTLDSFAPVASGTVKAGTTDFTFSKPVTSRYVLVWITGLVPSNGAYSADLAEVVVHAAG
ncbi:MAG: protein kinase family protein [Blastococcus sp.]